MTDQATKSRSAIALCCLNSAALLDLADQGIHEPHELERLRVANHAQAQFLRMAAELADEVVAALQASDRALSEAREMLGVFEDHGGHDGLGGKGYRATIDHMDGAQSTNRAIFEVVKVQQ